VRGFNTPKYDIEVTLSEFIPEWLPMFGKKVRIFHHGMPRQCNGCFEIGHLKWECKNQKMNWQAYVQKMKNSGKFQKELFGSWLDEKPIPGKPAEGDLRNLLNDPQNLRKALEEFLTKKNNQGDQCNKGQKNSDTRDDNEGDDRNQKRQGQKRRQYQNRNHGGKKSK
jgi:hypothetical protein